MLSKFLMLKDVIYTDVEGVYTTDPNKLKKAKKKVISTKCWNSISVQVVQQFHTGARLNRISWN